MTKQNPQKALEIESLTENNFVNGDQGIVFCQQPK